MYDNIPYRTNISANMRKAFFPHKCFHVIFDNNKDSDIYNEPNTGNNDYITMFNTVNDKQKIVNTEINCNITMFTFNQRIFIS